jgi:Leucine rich repeat
MKYFSLFIVFYFILQNTNAQVKNNARYHLGYKTGLGITKIKSDDTINSYSTLPFLDIYFNKEINQDFALKVGTGLSFRGGKSETPVTTYYLLMNDVFTEMNYSIKDYFQVGLGYQFSHNVPYTYIENLNLNMREADVINNNHEIYITSYLKVNRNLDIFFKANFFQMYFFNQKTIEIKNNYQSFMFGISFKLGSIGREKTSYKNKLNVSEPLHVEKLRIKNQDLKKFPTQIFEMKNLEKLSLINCNIDTIPGKISDLVNIEVLNFQKNKIKNIPTEVSLLNNLRSINISDNQIQNIPNKLLELPKLKKINVRNNPIGFEELDERKIKIIK